MAERSIIDQLDDAVSALLAKPAVEWPVEDPVVASLVGVAEELRGLPREDAGEGRDLDLGREGRAAGALRETLTGLMADG